MSLLDDYIDRELETAQTQQVQLHLESCTECSNEYNALARLRSLLSAQTAPEPGQEYWDETIQLILAKTVNSETPRVIPVYSEAERQNQRRGLLRALLSVAASLAIFFTAVTLGTKYQQRSNPLHMAVSQTTTVGSMGWLVDHDNSSINSQAEQFYITKGMLMMSPPGLLGRVEMLPDLLATR